MKLFLSGFFLLLVHHSATTQQLPHLGQPPANPQLFGEQLISTGLYERDFALSPDGHELFYTLQSPQGIFQTILYMKKQKDGKWSKPEVAPFAGRFSDLEPAFSPDGQKLFFSSNRPLSGNSVKDFDIWVVEKKNNQWAEPQNIGLPVNTPLDEYYPSVGRSGNIYFTAAYKNAVGKEDIYLSKWENGKYSEPLPVDTAINSKTYEFNAYVSPEEDLIVFTSYGRSDDKGRGDLYISKKDKGNWLPAQNLHALNSEKLDYCPFISPDKKAFYFTSERINLSRSYPEKPATLDQLIASFNGPQNGGGDIYWVSMESLLGLWKTP